MKLPEQSPKCKHLFPLTRMPSSLFPGLVWVTPKTIFYSHPMASWSFCLPVVFFFFQTLVKLFSRIKKKLTRLNKTLRWKPLWSVTAGLDFSCSQMVPVHSAVERLCRGVYKSQPCETELRNTPGHLAREEGIMSTGQCIVYRPAARTFIIPLLPDALGRCM